MAEITEIISREAIEGIRQTDTLITTLDGNLRKLVEAIAASNEQLKKQQTTQTGVNQSTTDAKTKAAELAEEQKKIAQIEERVRQNTDGVVRARIQASIKTKEQKERVTQLINAENKNIGTMQRLKNENKALSRERDTLNLKTAEGRKRLEEINAKLDENNNFIKGNVDQLSQQKIGIGAYSAGIENALTKMGLAPAVAHKVAGGFTSIDTAAKTTNKTLRFFKVALLSTGIGAFILALGALISYFKGSEEGQSKLNKIMNIGGVIIGNLTDILHDLGAALVAAFENPKQAVADLWEFIKGQFINRINATRRFFVGFGDILQGIWELDTEKISAGARDAGNAYIDMFTGVENTVAKVSDSVSGFYKQNQEEIKESIRLSNLKLETDRKERALMVEKAKVEAQIAELRLKGRQEEEYTTQERIRFMEEANKLQDDLASKEEEIAKNRLEIKRISNTFSESTKEDLDEEAQLEANIANIQAQRYTRNRQIQRELNTLNKELTRELEAQQKEVQKLADEAKNVTFDPVPEEDADEDSWLEAVGKRNAEILEQARKAQQDSIVIQRASIAEAQRLYEADIINYEEYQALKTEITAEQEENRREIVQTTADQLNQILNAGLAVFQATQDAKLDRLQTNREHELQMAEGNAEAQERINKKYDRKEAELKTKKARADKAAALIRVAIDTALAVSQANPNIPLMIFAAGIGLAQAIAIAKTPIPKYFTGTKSAKDGVISLAEKGSELVSTRAGDLFMADRPMLATGLGGARIYNNEETRRIMAAASEKGIKPESSNVEELLRQNGVMVRDALENQTHYHFETERIVKRRGNYKEIYLNRKIKGING